MGPSETAEPSEEQKLRLEVARCNAKWEGKGKKKRNFKEISGEITIIWELNQTKLFIVYRC